ncbi:MAG: TIGR00270 family protein [Nanoarchaeota archaeon]|nr:TIGR00270 family protein [Nanoarchaeota archaeon]
MPNCEMCGQETELVNAEIEGIEMTVCQNCARFGQVKDIPKEKIATLKKTNQKPMRSEPHLEVTESIIPDYPKKIREAREQLGLKQEDFAKKINEKESLLHKMETGSFKPSLSLARKLEKLLGIKLIQQIEEEKFTTAKTSSEGLTIGDLIKK